MQCLVVAVFVCLFVCLFVCGISRPANSSLSSFLTASRSSCFSQVVLRHRGVDRIYEMRCLFVAVGLNQSKGLFLAGRMANRLQWELSTGIRVRLTTVKIAFIFVRFLLSTFTFQRVCQSDNCSATPTISVKPHPDQLL